MKKILSRLFRKSLSLAFLSAYQRLIYLSVVRALMFIVLLGLTVPAFGADLDEAQRLLRICLGEIQNIDAQFDAYVTYHSKEEGYGFVVRGTEKENFLFGKCLNRFAYIPSWGLDSQEQRIKVELR